MASNLRNFRLDDETWETFVEQCKHERTSASAEIAAFVRAYLGGLRVYKGEVDMSLSERVDTLTSTVEELRSRMEGQSLGKPHQMAIAPK
jgi:hypothetical protein